MQVKYQDKIFLLLSLIFSACKEEILHNLNEADANRVVTHLSDVGISAEKAPLKENLWVVKVSQEDAVPAMRRLESTKAFLTRENDSRVGSFIPSREDQLFRHERQVSRGIEDTLRTMRGVLEARVHLNLPRIEILSDRTSKLLSSASVLLVVSESFVTNPAEITALVSGGSGVERDRVSVVVNRVPEEKE